MTPRLIALLMLLASWALVTTGAYLLWGLGVAALALGGLVWVDLYLGERLRGDT